MLCYFLNARKFVSKAGHDCFIFTIASPEGDVSEFFVSEDIYIKASNDLAAFDYIEISLTSNRGRFSISSFERAVRS